MENELTVQENYQPLALIEMAISKGADIAQLEKLMDLQERWEKKEAKKKFFDAMAEFQTQVPEISKKKTAKIFPKDGKPSFSYKYADLGTIVNAIKIPLAKCGLSYRWEFDEKETLIKCFCHITHRDGHTETTSMQAGKDASGAKNDIQQRGSTQTYLQRYTLIGALGLSTADEDNDGRNVKFNKNEDDQEADYLDQWRQSVKSAKTQIELTKLYLSNKKAVESDKKIQEIFKARESELKTSNPAKKEAVQMP